MARPRHLYRFVQTAIRAAAAICPARHRVNRAHPANNFEPLEPRTLFTALAIDGHFTGGTTFNLKLFTDDATLAASGTILIDWGDSSRDVIHGIPATGIDHPYGSFTDHTAIKAYIAQAPDIANGTTLSLGNPGRTALFSSLGIGSSGTFDLSDGSAIILNDSLAAAAARMEEINAWLASGYNAGLWNGPGIVTSQPEAAGGQTLVGALGADYLSFNSPTFAGIPVRDTDIVLKYTLWGDLTLDGQVNGDDLGEFLNFYDGTGGPGRGSFGEGDMNYDGLVNGDDLGNLLNNLVVDDPTQIQTRDLIPDSNALALGPPQVTSILPNDGTGANPTFTVTFDRPVTGVDTSDFAALTTGTVTGAAVTAVTGSGSTYSITVDPGTGGGTLSLKLNDNDSITDAGGNKLGGMGAHNGDFTSPATTRPGLWADFSQPSTGNLQPITLHFAGFTTYGSSGAINPVSVEIRERGNAEFSHNFFTLQNVADPASLQTSFSLEIGGQYDVHLSTYDNAGGAHVSETVTINVPLWGQATVFHPGVSSDGDLFNITWDDTQSPADYWDSDSRQTPFELLAKNSAMPYPDRWYGIASGYWSTYSNIYSDHATMNLPYWQTGFVTPGYFDLAVVGANHTGDVISGVSHPPVETTSAMTATYDPATDQFTITADPALVGDYTSGWIYSPYSYDNFLAFPSSAPTFTQSLNRTAPDTYANSFYRSGYYLVAADTFADPYHTVLTHSYIQWFDFSVAAAPAGINARRGTAMTLNWQDMTDNETGYEIQRRASIGDGTTFSDWTTVASLDADSTHWSDNTIDPTLTYQYQIRAVRASGALDSAWIQTQLIDGSPIFITAYRTGDNLGTPVSRAVQTSDDPSKYLVLVNNDYGDSNTGYQDRDLSDMHGIIVDGAIATNSQYEPVETDLAKITIKKLPSNLSGQVEIQLLDGSGATDSSNVKLFSDDGTLLYDQTVTGDAPLTLDLSDPSGYLSGLLQHDVNIWLEGTHAVPDFTFQVIYKNSAGNVTSRDAVHMDIAEWNFVDEDGDDSLFTQRVATSELRDLADNTSSSPIGPAPGGLKLRLDGVSSGFSGNISISSDSNSLVVNDQISVSDSAAYSRYQICLYSEDGDSSSLTGEETLTLQQIYHIDAVHNPLAVFNLEDGYDDVTRDLPDVSIQDKFISPVVRVGDSGSEHIRLTGQVPANLTYKIFDAQNQTETTIDPSGVQGITRTPTHEGYQPTQRSIFVYDAAGKKVCTLTPTEWAFWWALPQDASDANLQWTRDAVAALSHGDDVPAYPMLGSFATETDFFDLNNRISQAYAAMYNKDHAYLWAGLAAYGSHRAGQGIATMGLLSWLVKGNPASPQGPAQLYTAFTNLNIDIFMDAYRQFIAFDQGGLSAIQALAATNEITDQQLTAWTLLDQGNTAQKAGDLATATAKYALAGQNFAEVEQKVTAQAVYDSYKPIFLFMSTDPFFKTELMSTVPADSANVLFSFGAIVPNAVVAGPPNPANVADKDDRWAWVSDPTNGIWHEWVIQPHAQDLNLQFLRNIRIDATADMLQSFLAAIDDKSKEPALEAQFDAIHRLVAWTPPA